MHRPRLPESRGQTNGQPRPHADIAPGDLVPDALDGLMAQPIVRHPGRGGMAGVQLGDRPPEGP